MAKGEAVKLWPTVKLFFVGVGYVLFWGLLIAAVASGMGAACGCAVTPKAALRREAESLVRGCMAGTRCAQTAACVRESVDWCRAHGLEATCGTDGVFTDPILCPR